MPLYTVYFTAGTLSQAQVQSIGSGITEQHHLLAGSPKSAVKVVFVPVPQAHIFNGGEPDNNIVRATALLYRGRTRETKDKLLAALERVFAPNLPSSKLELTIIENDINDNVRYVPESATEAEKQWRDKSAPKV